MTLQSDLFIFSPNSIREILRINRIHLHKIFNSHEPTINFLCKGHIDFYAWISMTVFVQINPSISTKEPWKMSSGPGLHELCTNYHQSMFKPKVMNGIILLLNFKDILTLADL